MSKREELLSLAERVADAEHGSNALDVKVEVALFKPGKIYASVRQNDAGTKVIYTQHNGNEVTCWAMDWSSNPAATSDRLRALAAMETPDA